VPDQGLLLSYPGNGGAYVTATRGEDRSWAMIYFPLANQTATLDLGRMAGAVRAWWYDPRNGNAYQAGKYSNGGAVNFTSPLGGPDWVLVIDDLRIQFPEPGKIG
jgi:hypothetical protein